MDNYNDNPSQSTTTKGPMPSPIEYKGSSSFSKYFFKEKNSECKSELSEKSNYVKYHSFKAFD